jgi:hypothetical protein
VPLPDTETAEMLLFLNEQDYWADEIKASIKAGALIRPFHTSGERTAGMTVAPEAMGVSNENLSTGSTS